MYIEHESEEGNFQLLEPKRGLETRLKEQKTATRREEVDKSPIAQRACLEH